MSVSQKPNNELAAVVAERDWRGTRLPPDALKTFPGQAVGEGARSRLDVFVQPGAALFAADRYSKLSGEIGDASRELLNRAGATKTLAPSALGLRHHVERTVDLPRAAAAYGHEAMFDAAGELDVGRMIRAYNAAERASGATPKQDIDANAMRRVILAVSATVAPGVYRELDQHFCSSVRTVLADTGVEQTHTYWGNRA